MATSNFYNKNASHIFAIETENEDDYTDLIDNVNYSLREFADKNKKFYFNLPYETYRSGGGRYIGRLALSKQYDNFDVIVTIKTVIDSGYYSGANLDWDVEIEINGQNYDEINEDEFIESLDYLLDTKMAIYKGKLATKWANKALDTLRDEVEKIYALYTDKYVVAARFSNGETIYNKVD